MSSRPDAPSPHVLIVSYRRADLLAQCLRSVAAHLPASTVHVWDNHSEGSPQVRHLSASWPGVRWSFCEDNVGFARAVNRLAANTGEGDLLLLNPDAVLIGDLLECRQVLAAARRHHLPVAAVAPEVVDPQRGESWDNARRDPGALRWLVSGAGYAQRLRSLPCSDLYPEPPDRPVGYLSGACLLISRAAWIDVGPFDERYFLYGEEADWAHRARRRGWQLRLIPRPGARHSPIGTVAGQPDAARRSSELLYESQVRYLRDHGRPTSAWEFRVGTAVLDRLQRSKRRSRRRDATA